MIKKFCKKKLKKLKIIKNYYLIENLFILFFMKHTELVTIGILCFNSQDTILRAIESSINQSWKIKKLL